MPRTTQQNQTIREETQARIVAAALTVFAHYGYERASVRMIAQEAKVAQGLLYSYFDSKEQLLKAIFLQWLEGIEESFDLAQGGGTAEGRLEQLLRGSFAILERDRSFWTLFYNIRWQPVVAASLEAELNLWTARILAVVGGILDDLDVAEPQIEARVMFALIDGIGQQFVMQPEGFPVDAVITTIMKRWTGTQIKGDMYNDRSATGMA